MIDTSQTMETLVLVASTAMVKLREQIIARDVEGARETVDLILSIIRTVQELAELAE